MSTHRRYCISAWHPDRDDCTCGAALRTLAANLATGAALCRAFFLGTDGGFHTALDPYNHAPWTPGCGKAAP